MRRLTCPRDFDHKPHPARTSRRIAVAVQSRNGKFSIIRTRLAHGTREIPQLTCPRDLGYKPHPARTSSRLAVTVRRQNGKFSIVRTRLAHGTRDHSSRGARMTTLLDRIAVVTGAASGIGRATALLLAQHGAK